MHSCRHWRSPSRESSGACCRCIRASPDARSCIGAAASRERRRERESAAPGYIILESCCPSSHHLFRELISRESAVAPINYTNLNTLDKIYPRPIFNLRVFSHLNFFATTNADREKRGGGEDPSLSSRLRIGQYDKIERLARRMSLNSARRPRHRVEHPRNRRVSSRAAVRTLLRGYVTHFNLMR